MATGYRAEIEYVEYLDGKAHARVSGRRDHGLIVGQTGAIIGERAGERETVSISTDAILKRRGPKRTKLIPDVSFLSEAQYGVHPPTSWDQPPFSPEIAVEVVSPGESTAYLRAKFARYTQRDRSWYSTSTRKSGRSAHTLSTTCARSPTARRSNIRRSHGYASSFARSSRSSTASRSARPG